MSSLQCAYGLSELNNFNKKYKLKKKIGFFYNQKLKKFKFFKNTSKKK